jgi:archaellum component FlaC
MSTNSKVLVLPSPVRRPKPAPIAEQNSSELRRSLRSQALNLQRHAHFEAVVHPSIKRLTKEIKDLKQLCAEHKEMIQKLEEEIARCAEGAPQDQADIRQQKIERIIQLQEEYKQVLAEKETYIARGAGGL